MHELDAPDLTRGRGNGLRGRRRSRRSDRRRRRRAWRRWNGRRWRRRTAGWNPWVDWSRWRGRRVCGWSRRRWRRAGSSASGPWSADARRGGLPRPPVVTRRSARDWFVRRWVGSAGARGKRHQRTRQPRWTDALGLRGFERNASHVLLLSRRGRESIYTLYRLTRQGHFARKAPKTSPSSAFR
jgi:hypothetical protein